MDPDHTAADSYLGQRLLGAKPEGGDLLDGLTIFEAAFVMFNVGRVATYGRNPPPAEAMSQLERIASKAAGYEALSDWPNGFVRVLEDLSSKAPSGGRLGPHKVFGYLCKWLVYHDIRDFDPLRERIRLFYLTKWPASRWSSILGEDASSADFMTLGSAADQLGLSVERMRTIAVGFGYIEQVPLARTAPIKRSSVEEIAERLAHLIDSKTAQVELGVGPNGLKDLLVQGVVRNLLPGSRKRLFDKAEIDELIADMSRGARVFSSAPEGSRPLVAVAKSTHRAVSQLVTAIRSGALRPVGVLSSKKGLAAILLSHAEAKMLCHEIEEGFVREADAAKIAGVQHRNMKMLVDRGFFSFKLGQGSVRRLVRLYLADDMYRFREKYVSLFAILKHDPGCQGAWRIKPILDACVSPIVDVRGLVLYDRQKAREALSGNRSSECDI